MRERAAYARTQGRTSASHGPVMAGAAAAGTAAMFAVNGVGASAPAPFSFAPISIAAIGGFAGGIGLLGALLVLVLVVLVLIEHCGRPA